jgi:hypothetical protein
MRIIDALFSVSAGACCYLNGPVALGVLLRVCRWLACRLVGHRRHRDSYYLRPDLGGMGEDANGHTYSWTVCSRCHQCTLWWSPRFENYGVNDGIHQRDPDADEIPPVVTEVRVRRKLPPAMPLPRPGPGRERWS